MSERRLQRIEREARFEAARATLLAQLVDGRRDDGLLRVPGLVGRFRGRDVELRFPGGASARHVRVAARIRTGGAFTAAPRGRLLRWLGWDYMCLAGREPAADVRFAVERLLRDFGASRVDAGDGLVRALLAWDSAAPDPERVARVIDRLDRVASALEDDRRPLVESGGALSCPFCRELIAADGAIARCEACGTPYHPTCFEESRGCAIYGCRNRTARSSSGRLAAAGGASGGPGAPGPAKGQEGGE